MENSFEHTFIPVTSVLSGVGEEVSSGIYCLTTQIVNVIFIGNSRDHWILIDTGMPHSAEMIIQEAENRFGEGSRPQAILLTHGHFDHVGSIVELIEEWDVPVYAHELEIPYLTGKANYPKGDPTVDGGLVSELSPLFPNHGIDLGKHVMPLPVNGVVPVFNDWQWIHTPGHTPGHVSFFRDKDCSLIVGDAFVTVKQESLFKVITQQQEISGPPKYFTTDWDAARESVCKLKALHPSIAITGHGKPMAGEELTRSLEELVRDFDRIAMPEDGRFLH